MGTKSFTARITALILIVVLLFSLTQFTAFAEGDSPSQDTASNILSTTTAQLVTDSGTAKEIAIESYLTNLDDTDESIKPCDIIFIMDQSKWMNTDSDKGAQRAAVISEIKQLLESLEEPSQGEHRVALAGYGRLNMSASTDPYNASIYPGTQASGNNISLNTGYYTASGFVSQNGWSDVSQSDMTTSQLPQMSAGYRAGMTYDAAFMSLSEADAVLNEDTMLAWYAGASRMDAGLTLAEQLATVAKENDPDGERNLMVCILSSSLPIQNTAHSNLSTIRTSAVLTAADLLKDMGATIFAFGDYHASGKTMAGDIQDTEENFNYYMQQVCSEPDYFYSFSSFSSVTDALNAMITQIALVAAGEQVQEHTITVSQISDGQDTITLDDALERLGITSSILADSIVQVSYCKFSGYVDGEPTFESIPIDTEEVPLAEILQGGQLIYTLDLIPIPSVAEAEIDSEDYSNFGTKVVLTISAPVTVTYQWVSSEAGYVPDDAVLPEPDIVTWGASHAAASVKSTSGSAYFDDHYEFAGWYLDQGCTTAYTDTTRLVSDITLYGKWEKYLLVEYYWNYWETGYTTPDDDDRVVYGSIPNSFTPEILGYAFGGWYLNFSDGVCSDLYTSSPMTDDLFLYADWEPITDTVYTVRYYQQDLENNCYNEVTFDAQTLTGTTGDNISEITRTYEGYKLDHITYESSSIQVQSTPVTIQGDGSLVVRVYYAQDAYKVLYDGNGSDGGTVPTDDTAYPSGASVTVAQDTMTKENFRFSAWNTAQDGTGTSYDPGDTLSITQDTTLYAQWSNWSVRLTLTDDSSSRTPLSGGQFALYSTRQTDGAVSSQVPSSVTIGDVTWYLADVQVTGQDGTIFWDNLTDDEYYIVQLSPPENYELPNDTGRTVSAVWEQTVDVSIMNSMSIIVPTGVSVPNYAIPAIIAVVGCAGLVFLAIISTKRRRK